MIRRKTSSKHQTYAFLSFADHCVYPVCIPISEEKKREFLPPHSPLPLLFCLLLLFLNTPSSEFLFWLIFRVFFFSLLIELRLALSLLCEKIADYAFLSWRDELLHRLAPSPCFRSSLYRVVNFGVLYRGGARVKEIGTVAC